MSPNPNPNRHTNREARIPTTQKSFDALRSFASSLSTNKMSSEQQQRGGGFGGYAEGSGMQGGSLWTTPKESKKDKQLESSKHSSSSSSQPQKPGQSFRASGASTQPSIFSNLSISQPSGPIHQNAPAHLAQRIWTIQRWTPGIWTVKPWENWTTPPTLAAVGQLFTPGTLSMEQELGFAHHSPSRPELAQSDHPTYIDRNLMWEKANEINFNSLLKHNKWAVSTYSPECYHATDNLNDAAIRLIKLLEVKLDPRSKVAPTDQNLERLLINPRTRLSHAPIERLLVKGDLGDPLIFSVVQRFIQCGCPIKDLRIIMQVPPSEQPKHVKINDPQVKIVNELADSVNELFSQRYAWGAGPEMQRAPVELEMISWAVRQYPKRIDPIYGL